MAQIRVQNVSFAYDSSLETVFDDVSFTIDTDWKLGLTSRNGRGKTTLLKLFMGEFAYQGSIQTSAVFQYFPYHVKNEKQLCVDVMHEMTPQAQEWEFQKELSLLHMPTDILHREYAQLSGGEKTRLMLAALFLGDEHYLLIDEPTNHLDAPARRVVAEYLKSKQGFLLVSHDRYFLDECVDHMMSIERTQIIIERGNFSSWNENRARLEAHERSQNEKLKKDMVRLSRAAERSARWADKTEKSKFGAGPIDRGYIGAKSAAMMKRAKSTQRRFENAAQEKKELLQNVEIVGDLHIGYQEFHSNTLITASQFAPKYDGKLVCEPVNFTIKQGDKGALLGGNGSGKTSLLNCILGKNVAYDGELFVASGLKISAVSQDTSHLKGSLESYARNNEIDRTQFQTILRKMGFERIQFTGNIETFSGGQKKKVLIAHSLCKQAHIYLWDEPLNFIDVLSRIQIEELLQKYNATMLFVEHDKAFVENISTKEITLETVQ